jgi:hypothetical protein
VLLDSTAKMGIRAMNRVTATNIRANNTGSDCFGTKAFTNTEGVGDVAPSGEIALSQFAFAACNNSDATTAASAAAFKFDGTGSGLPAQVAVSNGKITNTKASAMFFQSAEDISVANITMACWATNTASVNKQAVRLGGTVTGATFTGLNVALDGSVVGTCAAQTGETGFTMNDGVTTGGPIIITGSLFDGGSNEGEVAIQVGPTSNFMWLIVNGNSFNNWNKKAINVDVSVGAVITGMEFTNNRFYSNSSAESSSGSLHIAATGNSTLEKTVISGNLFETSLGKNLVIDALHGGGHTYRGNVITGNTFSGEVEITDYSGVIMSGNWYGDVTGLPQDHTVAWLTDTDTLTYGRVGCIGASGDMIECTTATTASLVLGIGNGQGGAVTGGVFVDAECDGTSVTAGDALVRSGSANGQLAPSGSPGAGETIGTALTGCTSNKVNVLVGKR